MDRKSTPETKSVACSVLESLARRNWPPSTTFSPRMRDLGMTERCAEWFIQAMRLYGASSRQEVEARHGQARFSSIADYIANRRSPRQRCLSTTRSSPGSLVWIFLKRSFDTPSSYGWRTAAATTRSCTTMQDPSSRNTWPAEARAPSSGCCRSSEGCRYRRPRRGRRYGSSRGG